METQSDHESRTPPPSSRNQGFSMVEVMVAIGIIGVLSALATQGYRYYSKKTRDTVRVARIETLEGRLRAHLVDKAAPGNPRGSWACSNHSDAWGYHPDCVKDVVPPGEMMLDFGENTSLPFESITYYNYPSHGPTLIVATELPTPTPCCIDEGQNICSPSIRNTLGNRSYCVCLWGDPGQADQQCN